MRTSNFALRLQPSLMEEAKAAAKAEGVALNQLINIAVAEKLAGSRTVAFFKRYTRHADIAEAIALLNRPRIGEPPRPGDELPENWPQAEPAPKSTRKAGRSTRSKPPKQHRP